MRSLAMLGSCLLSAFLFFSVAFGAEKTNAEETQYQQLQRDWWQIFPDGNRNAGGPKFFNYALNISKNFTESYVMYPNKPFVMNFLFFSSFSVMTNFSMKLVSSEKILEFAFNFFS